MSTTKTSKPKAVKGMAVYVVSFVHNNYDTNNYEEVYANKADALKRMVKTAIEFSEEKDEEYNIEKIAKSGDIERAIDAFMEECNNGLDHRLSFIKTKLR